MNRSFFRRTSTHNRYKLPEDGPVLIDGAEEEIALSGHDSAILHCRFRSSGGVADNGAEILSSSGDGTIKLWDVAKKTDITTLKGHTADVGQFEAFNVNNLISISGDHSCKIWDIRKPGGAVEGRDNVSTEGAHLSSLAVFPDSSKMIFACGDTNGVIKMFDLRMTEPMAIYDRPEIWETMVPDGAPPPKMGLCSLAFSNSGRLLLSSFYNVEDENEDSHILAWDTLKGDPVSEFQAGKKQPHVSNRVHSLQVSPCGRVLFGAGWDTNIYMWQGK
jgi:WD40 repeat protein